MAGGVYRNERMCIIASGTFKTYGAMPRTAFDKKIDWLSDALKFMLTPAAHTPDQDLDPSNLGPYQTSITGSEVSGTGYTSGGITVTGKTESYVAASNAIKWVIDDIVFTTVTIADVRNGHLYDSTPGSAATNPLILYVPLDATLAPNAGNLTFDCDGTNGILQIIAS